VFKEKLVVAPDQLGKRLDRGSCGPAKLKSLRSIGVFLWAGLLAPGSFQNSV
jgi:hypothetical protein